MLSSSSAPLLIAVVFVLGAVLFAVGTSMVRRSPAPPGPAQAFEPVLAFAPWTAELAGTNEAVTQELRVDMIERLAMIGEPWCTSLLERARAQDPDASVRDAADSALLVIGARNPA